MMSNDSMPDDEGTSDQSSGLEEQSEDMQVALADLPKADATKVGDRVPMEVTSVDTENGTATLKCCGPNSKPQMGSGISKMASAYDEQG